MKLLFDKNKINVNMKQNQSTMANMRQLKIAKYITSRDTPSLDKYLKEIGRVKLLTAEEEVDLVRRIKQGDQWALETLTKANLLFVVSVAKQYQGRGLSLPDLISEGNIGLIKGIKLFDETRGFKLISYAVWWIRQQIIKGLTEHARIVRLPMNKIGSINKINKALARLEQEHERPPTAYELAEVLEMTLEEVKTSLNNTSRHVSMDAPLRDDSDSGTMMDTMINTRSPSPIEALMAEGLRQEIERSLGTLHQQEADVLRLYFGFNGNTPRTLEEIGGKFNLTSERIRQIKERALRKLRKSSKAETLTQYLG